jgi:hypothetical protein
MNAEEEEEAEAADGTEPHVIIRKGNGEGAAVVNVHLQHLHHQRRQRGVREVGVERKRIMQKIGLEGTNNEGAAVPNEIRRSRTRTRTESGTERGKRRRRRRRTNARIPKRRILKLKRKKLLLPLLLLLPPQHQPQPTLQQPPPQQQHHHPVQKRLINVDVGRWLKSKLEAMKKNYRSKPS